MNTVPFKVQNIYGGFAVCEGLLRDDGDRISLEFKIRDNIVGVFGTKVHTAAVHLHELVSVSLTDGWLGSKFGVKLAIETANLAALETIPTATQGRVFLEVAREDVPLAQEFVDELHRRQSQPA